MTYFWLIHIYSISRFGKLSRELSFFTGRGRMFVGGPEFFRVVKGGTSFFQWSKGAEFLEGHRGGDQKYFPNFYVRGCCGQPWL